jgi:tetratricopeptide (TPR) repeat protein
MVTSRSVLTALVLLFLTRLALADGPHSVSCEATAETPQVTGARAALQSSPDSLSAQLKLADALIDQGCYKQAVPVLEAGLEQRPRSSELQSRLRAARSMLNEEHFFEGLGNAQEAAKFQHDQLRCSKLGDISACDSALQMRPDDASLTVFKGDALLREGRAADALLVYRHAQELEPTDAGVKRKLTEAESQRQVLVSKCEGTADAAAVDACQAALLHGSADEFGLLKRKGILLQSVARPEPALDAFIAAEVLRQDDSSVALAVVALTDSTGRKDALALAARGSALLTLGRGAEALKALHEAQQLAPALPGIKGQLARAEQLAKEEQKRQASRVAKSDTPAPAAAVKAAPAVPGYSNEATAGRTN